MIRRNTSELKTVAPTGSYKIALPTAVEMDIEGRTASYWLSGDETLLQISSYSRESGVQVSARQRLAARLSRDLLANTKDQSFQIGDCPDVAAASGDDDEGVHWLFVYAVWPKLTVLLSVSHPDNEATEPSWALQAITSLTCPE